MNRLAPLVVFASLFAAAPHGAKAQEMGRPQDGLALAQQVCAKCHAVQKQETRSPNPLAPTFTRIATTPGMTAMALSAALRTSHRTMPNLILQGDDMANISAYILSLK